jgi:hypothetical protein
MSKECREKKNETHNSESGNWQEEGANSNNSKVQGGLGNI